MTNQENISLTGIENNAYETAEARMSDEKNILEALLKTAAFKSSEAATETIEIKRNGELMFSFRVRPMSADEFAACRKRATSYMPNPANKKLPKIEKEVNSDQYLSEVIVAATIAEDQRKIWGNPKFMERYDILQPWESVNILLLAGEKIQITDFIAEISGINETVEGESSPEDYAKN